MPEKMVINQGEVTERALLPKGVYSLAFQDQVAYLVKTKKDPAKVGLAGRLIPDGRVDDAILFWIPVNFALSDGLDSRRFLQGLAIDPKQAQWGGDVFSPEEIRPSEEGVEAVKPTNALLSVNGTQPIPVGFLRFKGEVVPELNKNDGKRSPKLARVLSRIE